MIASFVFEFETYCVNGYAAHANASTAPSRRPPKRSPTNQSPSDRQEVEEDRRQVRGREVVPLPAPAE